METLQQLADSLSRLLHCAVAIDDGPSKSIIQSCAEGRFDEARIRRMLSPERKPDPEGSRYLRSFATVDGTPARVPPNAVFGLDARIYVRLYADGRHLGALVVFDPDHRVTDSQLETVRAAADHATRIIEQGRMALELAHRGGPELLLDLLGPDPEARQQAQLKISENSLLASPGSVFVTVIRPRELDGHAQADAWSTAFELVYEEVSRRSGPRDLLHLGHGDHYVLLIGAKEAHLSPPGRHIFARELRERMLTHLPNYGQVDVVVGVGSIQHLSTAYLSYEHAKDAVRAASALESLGQVVTWDSLGIQRLLLGFPFQELSSYVPDQSWLDLVTNREHEDLVRTVTAYLQRGCKIKETADSLHIHRGTLYYRLQKVEELTGCSLTEGDQRLELYLFLKLASLSGINSVKQEQIVS